MLSQDEQAILSRVENNFESSIRFLQHLIRTPSFNPPGIYEKISTVIGEKLTQLGFPSVDVISVPPLPCSGTNPQFPKPNVLARWPSLCKKPCIILNAHMDTVPADSGWTRDPLAGEIENGIIYGRGAVDCKGDIAAFAYAVAALKESEIPIDGSILLAFTADEETGGLLGVGYLLEQQLLKGDFAIIEGFSYEIWNAFNGALLLELTTKGKSVHVSRKELGINAIEEMVRCFQVFQAYSKKIEKRVSTIEGISKASAQIGTIQGGSLFSIVPDTCTATFFRNVIPEEPIEDVLEEIDSLLDEIKRLGIRLMSQRLLMAAPAPPAARQDLLINSLQRASFAVAGEGLKVCGLPSWSDARFFQQAGIPVVGFGSGPKIRSEGGGHGPNENLRLDDFLKATKTLALGLFHFFNSQ